MRELKDRDLSENHRSGRTVWNPVKELKGGLVYALARRPRGEWNPEKELKVVESNLSHLSSLLRWNPEKELKDEARRGEQLHGWGPVESGEGIESFAVDVPINEAHHSKWNPEKELKAPRCDIICDFP